MMTAGQVYPLPSRGVRVDPKQLVKGIPGGLRVTFDSRNIL